MTLINKTQYGVGDRSYQAAGGKKGIFKLVDYFYQYMDSLPVANHIRNMHSEDLTLSKDKLACFLCGWMGGERLYHQKYGPISIPGAHRHLAIGEAERDAWLLCMQKALDKMGYAEDFKKYLLDQFFVPAERVRIISEEAAKKSS